MAINERGTIYRKRFNDSINQMPSDEDLLAQNPNNEVMLAEKILLQSLSKRYKIFFSHASKLNDSHKYALNEPPVLAYENQFVDSLYTEIKKKYSAFLDYRDLPIVDDIKWRSAYRHSNFGLFLCSPRFMHRWNIEKGKLVEEVKYFQNLNMTYGKKCIIPILYGVDKKTMDEWGPFKSCDHLIVITPSSKIEKSIEITIPKIIHYIDNANIA